MLFAISPSDCRGSQPEDGEIFHGEFFSGNHPGHNPDIAGDDLPSRNNDNGYISPREKRESWEHHRLK